MIEGKKNGMVKLTQISLFCAVSILLLIFIRIPLIPAAPFLIYDMADVPIIIGTLMYGSVTGLMILFVVSFIQAFAFGGDGWVGLIMHFISSGALVLCIGLSYKYLKIGRARRVDKPSLRSAIVGMILGVVFMTLLMIPMNYIFTVNFYGVPKQVVEELILVAIVPFNLIKGIVNCGLSCALFKALQPFIKRNIGVLGN